MLKKILGWILGRGRIGTTLEKTRAAVDGKKQLLASLAAAIPASITILHNYGEHGTPYLLNVASTPEFTAACAGWIGFFNALKGEKIRKENAQILEGQTKAATPSVAVAASAPHTIKIIKRHESAGE